MIYLIIGLLLIISFVWALWSMKKESTKLREVEETKKKLHREKILFKR